MSHYRKLSLLAIALATVGTVAYATKNIDNDAIAIVNAKIPLAQAVAAAEQHANGTLTENGKFHQASDELHFDHILPFSRGGTSLKAENVQLLCARHNLRKSAKIQ